MYQPEDHLESVGSLCVGDRAGCLQHRLGCSGYKSGTARPEDAARGCVSAVERDVCTFEFCILFLFLFLGMFRIAIRISTHANIFLLKSVNEFSAEKYLWS